MRTPTSRRSNLTRCNIQPTPQGAKGCGNYNVHHALHCTVSCTVNLIVQKLKVACLFLGTLPSLIYNELNSIVYTVYSVHSVQCIQYLLWFTLYANSKVASWAGLIYEKHFTSCTLVQNTILYNVLYTLWFIVQYNQLYTVLKQCCKFHFKKCQHICSILSAYFPSLLFSVLHTIMYTEYTILYTEVQVVSGIGFFSQEAWCWYTAVQYKCNEGSLIEKTSHVSEGLVQSE